VKRRWKILKGQWLGMMLFIVGEKAVADIKRTVAGADVELMLLDLGRLDSVREFAAKLHSTVDKVFKNVPYF
jgi:hypothetical protein